MRSSPLRRAVQGLTMMIVAVLIVGGYLGLRALVWRQEYQIATMIQSGLVVSVVVGGLVGVLYILFGSALWRLLSIDWLSLQFGALVGALLYGIYNAIAPLTPYSTGETPGWRFLQGATDGLAIGLVLGVLVMLVSGRPLRLDRAGVTRYLILFVAVVLVAWVILLIKEWARLSDALSLTLILPLMVLLKLVVNRLDRRGYVEHYDDYGYDEGGD
jgi:hypothetical protein